MARASRTSSIQESGDFAKSRFFKIILIPYVAVLFFAPVSIYINAYHRDHHLGGMPSFGALFRGQSVAEIRELHVPVSQDPGYDGQFYAQLALDPMLWRAQTAAAMDAPRYRAERIGMPIIAYLLGLGHPRSVVVAYSLINGVCWVALLTMLLKHLSPWGFRGLAVCAAILLSHGTLVSIDRALTDLPATTFLTAALLSPSLPGRTGLFAASVLCRETGMLSAAGLSTLPEGRHRWIKFLLPAIAAGGLLLAWQLRVRIAIPHTTETLQSNLAVPFKGYFDKLVGACRQYQRTRYKMHLFEFLAPVSLGVQALFFCLYIRIGSPLWRFGFPWACLVFFLGPAVWVEQTAFTRVLLPLTLAFNLKLMRDGFSWAIWLPLFVAGNAGLCWSAVQIYKL